MADTEIHKKKHVIKFKSVGDKTRNIMYDWIPHCSRIYQNQVDRSTKIDWVVNPTLLMIQDCFFDINLSKSQ
jgi:hypothetical protein